MNHSNLIPIVILGGIFIGILIYLHVQENFTSPAPTDKGSEGIYDLLIQYNQQQYQEYQKEIQDLQKKTDFKFGYSKLEDTNPQTIGICPLGQYLPKDKYTGNSSDIKDCQPCYDCQAQPGYYVLEGCVGDSNANCKFLEPGDKKLPLDIFTRAHRQGSHLHSQLPKDHEHQVIEGKYSRQKVYSSGKQHQHY